MSSISIIGLGNMARAIGTRAVVAGHSVQLIGRDPAKAAALADDLGGAVSTAVLGAAVTGDIVILAVPYSDVLGLLHDHAHLLAGKVIVDISNPFHLGTLTDLVTPPDSSAAQEIAKVVPADASVVRAFNTLFAGVLASGQAVDVFLAGDDAGARAAVASLITSLGLRPLDAGDLKYAHWLEGAGLLILGQAARRNDFSVHLAIAA